MSPLMRAVKTSLGGLVLSLLTLMPAGAVTLTGTPSMPPAGVWQVQAAPSAVDQQRNCQTLRNCQFSKGGSFRGCVSSYSCRTCRFVPSSCSVGSARRTCQRQVCEWGA